MKKFLKNLSAMVLCLLMGMSFNAEAHAEILNEDTDVKAALEMNTEKIQTKDSSDLILVDSDAGATVDDANMMQEDIYYARDITKDNQYNDFYNKIVLEKDQFILIVLSRIRNENKESVDFKLTITNERGEKVWEVDTAKRSGLTDEEVYSYRAGLAKGTYYLNISRSGGGYFSEYYYDTMLFSYGALTTENSELEPNNTLDTATPISGYWEHYAGSLDGDMYDYFSFYSNSDRVEVILGIEYDAIMEDSNFNISLIDSHGSKRELDFHQIESTVYGAEVDKLEFGTYYICITGSDQYDNIYYDIVLIIPDGWNRDIKNNKEYWYEDGVKQGTEGRGKEIYDPETDAWYWLGAVQGGAKTISKDVYQESQADDEGNIGKWVRYDETGHMVKGWDSNEDGIYYFDMKYGTMYKGYKTIDGVTYYFDDATGITNKQPAGGDTSNGWVTINGKEYWYENGVRQGYDPNNPAYRGKEIYDPGSDAWYWLDNVQQGAKAVSKDVYQESYNAYTDSNGKWVRYDENGRMIKDWQVTKEGTFYFEPVTGSMAKGRVVIEGKEYNFDQITGVLQQ